MKKYEISKLSKNCNTVRIINKDENPIILEVECDTYKSFEQQLWSVSIDIKNETNEMRKLFHTVPNICLRQRIGNEAIINELNMDNIIQIFKIIQTVDPIPLNAFSEIMNLIDFDLSEFLSHGSIQQHVKHKNHSNALQLAIEATVKGDHEALPLLANIYQEEEDISNYINVLTSIPPLHPSFVSANEAIHSYLLTLPIPEIKEEKIQLLERKFKAALNSNETRLSTCYLNELTGKNGLQVTTNNIQLTPDTMIEMARDMRNMRKELEELRSYKAKNEAGIAAERRLKAHQAANDNNSTNRNESTTSKHSAKSFFSSAVKKEGGFFGTLKNKKPK